ARWDQDSFWKAIAAPSPRLSQGKRSPRLQGKSPRSAAREARFRFPGRSHCYAMHVMSPFAAPTFLALSPSNPLDQIIIAPPLERAKSASSTGILRAYPVKAYTH